MNYRIDEFKTAIGPERTYVRSGVSNYVHGNSTKHIYEFLCDPNYKINKVAKISGGVVQDTFELLERINLPNGPIMAPIHRIEIGQGNDCVLHTSSGSVRLNNAIKYIEPKKGSKNINNSRFSHILAKIEKSYPSIRLEKTLKKSIPSTVEEFLIKYFKELNKEKDTIVVETKQIQTSKNRRRSLGDIYMLCKYYFPKVTLDEIIGLLYGTKFSEKIGKGFRTSYCFTINRRVWYYSPCLNSEVANTTYPDEFGNVYSYYTQNLKV